MCLFVCNLVCVFLGVFPWCGGLTEHQVPHYFFIFILVINMAFLIIEARRYQIFLATRARVRMLESGFFCHSVMHHVPIVHPDDDPDVARLTANAIKSVQTKPMVDWEAQLKTALLTPVNKKVKWSAVYVRLHRTYAHLFFAIYVGWIVKLASRSEGFSDTIFWSTTAFLFFVVSLIVLLRPRHDDPEMEFT